MKKKIIRVVTSGVSLKLISGQLKYLNEQYEVQGVASNDTNLSLVEQSEGIKIHPIKMVRPISLINDLKSLYNLYRLFKKEKPFVVHSITPKAGLLSMMAAYLARVPHRMHTFTGLIFPTKEGVMKKILITTDKILCACATQIYPEGYGVKQDLENYNITSKPLKVLANGNINGLDLDYFSKEHFNEQKQQLIRKELNITNNEFVFVFVGRLVKDKGINELVSVFNKNFKITDQATLLLVGDYEETLDPLLPETINNIKTNTKIIETGWVNDVRPYFSIANALVFPSYREGFPNVVMQAGAMGLPALVTDINGSNEIIIEGENGAIIPAKDEASLYVKMREFYENKNKFQASVCRELITTRYERQKVWEAVLNEYKSLS
ncbi:glycosyl transferase family 1 [Pseudalgibacter alginicilyticus]|uniref:Glycosyl transferase family 1 n=1 Tax=Pseudalgibacter alginicilyticus TaxID=1736674 RepID=A0A0P0D888_9FLAO|nr:glycosyltransferase family 4 protein [Pseudalgibacter alginicilyticus]ALJ04037.1 glycosyl transferase family 1 [Pseudalgibacter alginicilyticus]